MLVQPLSFLFSLRSPPGNLTLHHTVRWDTKFLMTSEAQVVSKGHEVLSNIPFHIKYHLIDMVWFSNSYGTYILMQRWPNQWIIKSLRILIYYHKPVPPPISLNCSQLFPSISPSHLTYSLALQHIPYILQHSACLSDHLKGTRLCCSQHPSSSNHLDPN